ncbi:MAG TPA: hypothetical protein VOA64_07555 [Candidatus Dormibacteraeota bacterium]|nr:hypothetical protein [Candidatus Dormibacteraeota bacterium]
MKRSQSVLLFFIILLIFPAAAHAQAWSGIISPSRAMDWSVAGIPGGLPDSSWPVCQTIAPYTGTSTAITNALSACQAANPTGGVVALGAGTFTLSNGISFPQASSGHIVLRGQGANATQLNFSGSAPAACNGQSGFVCASSTDGTYRGNPGNSFIAWTSGYAQGSTQLTLASVAGLIAGKTLLLLNQCDTGFSGAACTTGNAVDNGGYFECAKSWVISPPTGCAIANQGPDGPSWRPGGGFAYQHEIVQVVAINQGGCGATCVTISQPLEHPNWNSGQTPEALAIQPIPQIGVENLSIDASANEGTSSAPGPAGISYGHCWQCWVSGTRISNTGSYGIAGGKGQEVAHNLYQNNYVFGNPVGYGDNAGFYVQGGGNLTQNNICQQRNKCYFNDGPDDDSVIAYNFSVNQYTGAGSNDLMGSAAFHHSAGDDFTLFEGNAFNDIQDDNVHGTHLNTTIFRNFVWGWESCANGQCGAFTQKNTSVSALIQSSFNRYAADVANVLGTPGYHTTYVSTGAFAFGDIYNLGNGNPNAPAQGPDPLVASTMLRWGNWDSVTNAVRWCGNSSDTGWSTTCASTSEVPTGAPAYPNSVPTKGDTGAGQAALPASFYLSTKPSWFGSIPWPAIGPDVTGGNIGQCSGVINIAGHQSGLPATSNAQCVGTSLTTPAWGGHVYANPAMACYFSMGGLPDGTGSVLAFDAKTCYGLSTLGGPRPQPPTNLVVIVD